MDYLDLPGGRFAYIDKGRGYPVLLLHGLGSSLLDWQPQIEHLARCCRVLALDVRGHGESEPLRAPVNMSELAGDVADFIHAMAIDPCIVVGISMGGMLTFQLLTEQPQLVRAAVVINSAPSFVVDSWKVRTQVWLRLGLVRLFGLPGLARMLAGKLFPKPEQQALRELVAQRIAGNDPVSYMHAMRAIPGWSTLPAVAQVETPLLVVCGDRDYTPVAVKEAYVAQLRNAHLEVVEDSGHATPLDQPERLNLLLEEFIAEHSAALPA
ncbi:alpha/beta fold hydrolase [Aquipseudomonas ullengensis]|uniref:Alpha/beta hydrolase n=1 Tax=Aquipseudomonas ullengensis TaxID=2759166 RepID=A0A7W4QBS5_9GAMM|nr:alpha/beta hydrolase [Pseudomonas ullengensis]MBB2494236.1 alpha/beta hydrolase [Pseudomonas ullengensis]